LKVVGLLNSYSSIFGPKLPVYVKFLLVPASTSTSQMLLSKPKAEGYSIFDDPLIDSHT